MHALVKAGLATGALAASLVVAAPANAATQHCDKATYPNKVELANGGTTYQTGLEPGTQVCIKAGNAVDYVTVEADGTISTEGTDLVNKKGKAQGISYFAYGEGPTTNPGS